MANPMEEMMTPCPRDECDGSGLLEDGRKCLCRDDEDGHDPDID